MSPAEQAERRAQAEHNNVPYCGPRPSGLTRLHLTLMGKGPARRLAAQLAKAARR